MGLAPSGANRISALRDATRCRSHFSTRQLRLHASARPRRTENNTAAQNEHDKKSDGGCNAGGGISQVNRGWQLPFDASRLYLPAQGLSVMLIF
jgi:hypothetical protein